MTFNKHYLANSNSFLANVEQKVTEFVDFDKRLRVLEDIVLKKAS